MKAVSWAQGFARTNRQMMMAAAIRRARPCPKPFECDWRR
jgi:RNA-splicing ligase RtcB